MAGLPGTGKTTLARELANRISGRVLSKDEIRHAIFRSDEVEYSSRQDDFCMQIMLATAAYLLQRQRERFVFLDGRTISLAVTRSTMQLQPRLRCNNPGEFSNASVRKRPPNDGSNSISERRHPAGNRRFPTLSPGKGAIRIHHIAQNGHQYRRTIVNLRRESSRRTALIRLPSLPQAPVQSVTTLASL